jgi:hypothetical protein
LRDWIGLLVGLKDALVHYITKNENEAKRGMVKWFHSKAEEKVIEIIDFHKLVFGSLAHSDLYSILPPSVLVSQLSACILYFLKNFFLS